MPGGKGQDDCEDLNRGILRADVSPVAAYLLIIGFLTFIFAVPITQAILEVREGKFHGISAVAALPTRENLNGYEKALERGSLPRAAIQRRLQLILSSVAGVGNSDAIIGRDGGLFYRPGIELVGGRGVLDQTRLRTRRTELLGEGAINPSPDPRPAILAFDEDCRYSGVHLVVVPVPDKASIQPGQFSVRFAAKGPIRPPLNPDFLKLITDLRAAGVDVFDSTPATVDSSEPPRFLRQDTHWTPEWAAEVARNLAHHVSQFIPPGTLPPRRLTTIPLEARRVGDLVDMLKLPAWQTLFPAQTVFVRQVRDAATGELWEPNANAQIVLLGDSFSNVFTADELGWGRSAGLPAQIALALGTDIDVIARNGSGATGTRREFAHRPDPLAGKTVVLWEFAARELMTANWEVVRLPAPRPAEPTGTNEAPTRSAPSASPVSVKATVVAASKVPQPFTVPYKDCLTYVKLRINRVLDGDYPQPEMLAVFRGMRDNELLPAASFRPGQLVRFVAQPFQAATGQSQSIRSVDDLDDYDHVPFLVIEER